MELAMGGLLKGLIGGVVGGIIGAVVWAVIAYQFNVEIGWIAVGVGVLVGVGVAAGAQDEASPLTGVMAAVIAIAAIGAGKFAAVSAVVGDAVAELNVHSMEVDDEMAIAFVARLVADEYEQGGKLVRWPGGERPAYPSREDVFPFDVWSDAKKRWESADDGWRHSHRDWVRATIAHELKHEVSGEAAQQVFVDSLSPFDLLWAVLAIGAAFGVGSGAGLGGGDD